MFTISKFNGSFNGTKMSDTASSKNKTSTQKLSVVPDFSLNALTKELEMRKKRLNLQDQ